eukprot:TRINITY_DN846_c0_g1_i4.p1 TRINITY_DN846_c0_g1~~TRINITY_DN846_c0_g1_i4.p1  ORF type:complete len:183 (+),score=12.85 TRINITY_DN846_c0_g1_i4:152-700(+)
MISWYLCLLFAAFVLSQDPKCGAPCHNNNECFGSDCHRCTTDPTGKEGNCTRGFPCGASCSKNSDCDETGSCTLCSSLGVCIQDPEGCGTRCNNDFQCDSDTCNRCVRGVCSPGAACGQSCDVDMDCSKYNNCNWCLANTAGVKKCGVHCLSPCSSDDQCRSPLCPKCVQYGPGPEKWCYKA